MRFMVRDLRKVYVFTMQEPDEDSPDFYVGQKPSLVFSHVIRCNVQPAKSLITIEAYGERVSNMFSLLCPLGTKIGGGDMVSFTGQDKATHKIISVEPYNTHLALLAERVI